MDDLFIPGFVLGCIFSCLIVSFLFFGMEYTYKDGQIDALNGIIRYELVKQEDGSVTWESIHDSERRE